MAYSNITTAVFISQPSRIGQPEPGTHGTWEPNTDVYVTAEGLIITVELAGIRGEDVEITSEANRLHIRGERPDCCRSPGCRFLVMSINFGPFAVSVELPAGFALDQARASYLNGFLRITVPPVPAAAPKKPRRSPVRANA
jgi:HSP20 family protein